MKSHKTAATMLVLLAAMLIVPCRAQTPETETKPKPKPLDTNISSIGKLFPADTKVLIRIDLHALIDSGQGMVSLREDVLKQIPGFEKFYDVIKKAEISPFIIEKGASGPEWKADDNVKAIYIAKASLSDDANDITVLLVGDANLKFTADRFKENENITVKADDEIKGYEITGLLAKDETLYMAQLNGAIAVARTREAVAGYLDRQAKGDEAESMKNNEAMYHLAQKEFLNKGVLNAVVLFDEAQRKKFAEAGGETAFLKDIATFRLGIRSTAGSYVLESRCECVDEQAAKNISAKLKALKLGATLAPADPQLRRFYNSAEVKIYNKTFIMLEIPFNVEQIKLMAFGNEKEEEPEPGEGSGEQE